MDRAETFQLINNNLYRFARDNRTYGVLEYIYEEPDNEQLYLRHKHYVMDISKKAKNTFTCMYNGEPGYIQLPLDCKYIRTYIVNNIKIYEFHYSTGEKYLITDTLYQVQYNLYRGEFLPDAHVHQYIPGSDALYIKHGNNPNDEGVFIIINALGITPIENIICKKTFLNGKYFGYVKKHDDIKTFMGVIDCDGKEVLATSYMDIKDVLWTQTLPHFVAKKSGWGVVEAYTNKVIVDFDMPDDYIDIFIKNYNRHNND